MSIGPLSPVNFTSAAPLAQAKGAAAERAAQSAEAHARFVDGQQRSAAAAQVDGTMGDNNITDDHESAGQATWQAPPNGSGGDDGPEAGSVDRDGRLDRDAPLYLNVGAGLDLSA